jgi:hypothetical protein
MQISTRMFALGGSAVMITASCLGGATMVNAATDVSSPTLHMRFTAHTDRNFNFGPRTFGGTEIDTRHGHRVGLDMISGAYDPSTDTVTIYVAVARRGGLLNAKLHSDESTPRVDFVGRVTGGSGHFKGASGTVVARNVGSEGTRTRVLVTYTLP